MQGKSRLIGLDFVRGIAALIVMLQHTFEASGHAVGDFDPFRGWTNLGQAGVVAFFLVSGFVIPMSLEKTGDQKVFWCSRAFRIYPMYFTSFFLTVIFLNGAFDARTVISHIFFVQEFVPHVKDHVPNSWTLSLELTWYIGTSVLFALSFLNRSRLLLVLVVAVSVLVGCLSWRYPQVPVGRYCMLVSCVIGLFLYRQMTGQSEEKLKVAILVAVVAVLMWISFRAVGGIPRNDLNLGTVGTAWALGYGIFFAGLLWGAQLPGHVILAWLGRISFSVYLLHPHFIALAEHLGIVGYPLMPFVIVTTAAASSFTYRFIELPGINLGRKLSERGYLRSSRRQAAKSSAS